MMNRRRRGTDGTGDGTGYVSGDAAALESRTCMTLWPRPSQSCLVWGRGQPEPIAIMKEEWTSAKPTEMRFFPRCPLLACRPYVPCLGFGKYYYYYYYLPPWGYLT